MLVLTTLYYEMTPLLVSNDDRGGRGEGERAVIRIH